MFTLYATPLSGNGRKALAVCRHLGLAPDVRHINVYRGEGRAPAYRDIHPLGKVPALVDSDLTLWESNAILVYIAEAYGDCVLWSREPKRRADISRWLHWESSAWQPALARVLGTFVAHELGLPNATGPASVDWSDGNFQTQATFLDAHLCGRAFITGDELTLADFSVAAMMMYVRHAQFPFDVFPEIGAWYERVEQIEAWKETGVSPWRY